MMISTDFRPNPNISGNTSEKITKSATPRIMSRLPKTGSPVFIGSPSFSSHSGHNSRHGKLRQTFSSQSRNGSIPGVPHQLQLRSSFSFVHFPSLFRSISFSRIASMINSERLRYPKSERFRIVSSITPISSSGIETVVYPRDIFPLYICDKLGFLSDEHGMYHNHYKYGRYM